MKRKLFLFFSLCLFAVGTIVAQQQVRVNGTVVDENGEPAIGATIQVKGTTVGTVTDAEGHFTVSAPSNGTLIISYVGFTTQEIPVSANVRVTLQTEVGWLDDVIVVAYGTTRRSSFTGSAAAVGASQITNAKVESLDKALAGKVSGVRVTSLTGDPGSGGGMQIRGIGSITGSTTPLYVIDGIPMTTGNYGGRVSSNVLSSINPEDIQSITVLKDAAAASLYGSRAANGVVVVTTKKGQSGKTRFNVKGNTGFSNMATNSYEMMSANEYLDYHRASLEGYYLNAYQAFYPDQSNYGNAEIQAAAKQFAEDNYMTDDWSYITERKEGDDWRKLIYDGGNQNEIQFSASGGDEKTTFFASLGYNKVKGLVKYREFERYSSMLNLSNKATNWLELSLKNQMSYTNQTGRGDQSGQDQGLATASPLSMMVGSNPAEKAYNPDGSYNMNAHFNGRVKNALWSLSPDASSITNKTVRMINNVGAKVLFTENFTFNSNNSIDYFTVKHFNYWGPASIDGSSLNGLGEINHEQVSTITTSNVLNYTNTFNSVHNLGLIAGVEAQKYNNNWHFASASDYSNDVLKELANAQPRNVSSGYVRNFMLSYLGNATYNYDDRYYLAASLRTDKSSKLGLNNRKGTFYSVSGSWRFTGESFFENDVITDGRLRFSYGTNGALPGGSYAYMGLYSFAGTYGTSGGSYLAQLANNDLGWEKSNNMNVGLDFTLFDRFSFILERFDKYTSNLLLAVPISYMTGASSITMNSGEISNRGWEFEFHGADMLKAPLTWDMDFTLATLKATVEKLPDGDIIAGDGDLYIYREKEDLYSFYMPTYIGVDPESGIGEFAIDPTKPDTKENRTSWYSRARKTVQQSAYPKVSGGLGNTFTYKGVSLNVLLTYQFGGHLFDYPNYFFKSDGLRNFSFNLSKELVGNYWQKPGDVVENMRPIINNPRRSERWSTRHIHSTDFIRLKELALSYSLPQQWYGSIGLSNVELSFVANNVAFLHAATKNMELEVALNGYRTVDTPMARTFSFGINVSF
ncbi:MAG: SusC/RagA family TonB-linked outer membrane protein [Fermentimonas sp.]|jgi:TonB-linked SusC/RagA family outer membrane protein